MGKRYGCEDCHNVQGMETGVQGNPNASMYLQVLLLTYYEEDKSNSIEKEAKL